MILLKDEPFCTNLSKISYDEVVDNSEGEVILEEEGSENAKKFKNKAISDTPNINIRKGKLLCE